MATLPLVVALAVRRAIASFLPPAAACGVKVKWPNDVVFGEASPEGFSKMCGISTEWKSGSVCVGIGVNVRRACQGTGMCQGTFAFDAHRKAAYVESERPLAHAENGLCQSPRNLPTYMSDILGGSDCPPVSQVRDAVLRGLAAVYDEWLACGFAPFRNEYMQCFALLGAEARIDDAAVLDEDGSLVAGEVPCCSIEGVTDKGLLVVRPCGSHVPAKVASGTVTIGHFLKNDEGLDHD